MNQQTFCRLLINRCNYNKTCILNGNELHCPPISISAEIKFNEIKRIFFSFVFFLLQRNQSIDIKSQTTIYVHKSIHSHESFVRQEK